MPCYKTLCYSLVLCGYTKPEQCIDTKFFILKSLDIKTSAKLDSYKYTRVLH